MRPADRLSSLEVVTGAPSFPVGAMYGASLRSSVLLYNSRPTLFPGFKF